MTWLSISLFCKKAYWHQLLAEGIAPFVNNMGGIAAYEIAFDSLNGQNIRLGMFTERANAYTIAKAADEHFKAFFKNAEYPSDELILPVERLFMPFSTNSIKFGLYIPQRQVSALSIGLSKIILIALKDDLIDDDTMSTFAFYLQIGMIKVIGKNETAFNSIVSSIAIKYYSENRNIGQEKFEQNRPMLLEITMDILHNHSDMPRWVKEWMTLCEGINNTRYNDPVNNYNEMIRLVYKQLGIDDNISLILAGFITACFAEVNIKG